MVIRLKKTSSSFTLMELLIFIALISIIATAVLVLFNPKKQIEKSWDGKRKNELNQLKKVLEDWYNDKNRYPKPNEICYDGTNNPCHICGQETESPSFSPYLSRLPCDPQHPQKDYLYQAENSDNPRWFRIYTDLNTTTNSINDPDTEVLKCFFQGCGQAPNYGYDYGVTSPNQDLERTSSFTYCAITGCNTCRLNDDPTSCYNYSIDRFCQGKKLIFPSLETCIKNCPCQ